MLWLAPRLADDANEPRHKAEREGSLRHLHPQILRGGARTGIQFAVGAARGLRGLITSQRHEGWVCLRAAYDDGGFSGATMARPALQRLLADITAGRVDIVVVYKIDRLTRSLADFAKIVEILDARSASFVGSRAVKPRVRIHSPHYPR